jgi:predicted transcriptional regulator
MRLSDYLDRTGETQLAFAKRSGVPQSTVSLICKGGGARAETAIKIIEATGGLVKLEDLVPGTGAAA